MDGTALAILMFVLLRNEQVLFAGKNQLTAEVDAI